MKTSILLQLIAAATLTATARTTPITVSNVTAHENMTDESITISYDLSNEGEPAYVTLDILTNGTSIGSSHIKSLSGAYSTSLTNFIAAGANKVITWQARKDWPGNVSTQATARVYAYYTNYLDRIPGVYMVVDLSKGATATAADPYPVHYTLMPPDPENDDCCCSNQLWLKRIEKGSYYMGSPTDEPCRDASHEQRHKVTFTNSFFIGVFPVTRAQYALVTGAAVSSPVLCPINYLTYNAIRGSTDDGIDWTSDTSKNTGHNVLSTSFLGILRSRAGGSLAFDLPTDAQWEYACRAGTTNAWNNGTDFNTNTAWNADENLKLLGWYGNGNSWGNASTLMPVGQKLSNAWGLYDCHGNIAEWCLDWYGGLNSYDETEPAGGSYETWRVTRGGSYASASPGDCRSACRINLAPKRGYANNGLRLVCPVSE